MRTFTRGRLVPRQPWAIKSTTRTELLRCDIRNGGYIHLDIGITPTALRRYNIHNVEYIHWNIDIIPKILMIKKQSIAYINELNVIRNH